MEITLGETYSTTVSETRNMLTNFSSKTWSEDNTWEMEG
jgi:hypothetical protein